MDNKGRIRKMFPGGNTTKGFHSFFDYIIGPDAAHIFIIKGGPGVGKSTFMRAIGDRLADMGYDLEHHHCSSDPASLDALVIPTIGVALLDGTAPHINDPKNPGVVDEIINLGDYWDEDMLTGKKEIILKTNKKTGRHFAICYSLLKESKIAYDEWQSYISEAVDKAKYNRIAKILVENLLGDAKANYQTAPKARHLFASAISPKGILDYKESLISEGMKVYTIKGQPGTGVKELIEYAAKAAEGMGLYTEQFHCPYEPDKLDMLIIPALNSLVMNISAPYHFDADKLKGVQLTDAIDLDICIDQSITAEYKDEITDASQRVNSLIEKAVSQLKKAMDVHDEIEGFYIDAMNFDKVNALRDTVLKRILKYANI